MYGYGLVGGDTGGQSSQAASTSLSKAKENELLASLSRNTGTAFEQLGLLLDTPGAIARGVLAGDPTSGFNWDYDKRTSGRELLESYGVIDKDTNPYAATALGLATEIAADPFSIISLPMSSLTKAGKAAKAANILDLAPVVAQSQMGNAARTSLTGRAAENALNELLPRGLALTPENMAVRPLVGPRVARTKASLDDVVQAAPDPMAAMERVQQYLTKKGWSYDDIKDQKLGGAFGVGMFSPLATFTPPGSERVLDALDAAGQAIGWSYPARMLSGAFDERVRGTFDAGDQIAAIRQFNALDAARGTGRRMAREHAATVTSIPMSDRAKSLLGADSLLSEQGNDFLTRMFEGKATAADQALARELPGVNRAVASWDRIRRFNAAEADRLGINFAPLTDPKFGVQYSPRSGTEFDFGEYGTGFGRSMFEARTNERFHRNVHLFTPGGTADLREVSKLPLVRQWAMDGQSSQYTRSQIGSEIASYLNRKHGYQAVDQAQGEGIASVLYRMNKDLPQNTPAFAGHPLNEQTRVIISQELARANANHVYDSLAEAAVDMAASDVPGAGFKQLSSAMQEVASRVGLKTGATGLDPAVQRQLSERIAAKMGIAADQVDLSRMAVPEEVYNRLSRINDFYSSPRVQQEVSGMLDSLTQFWKASILAFPARHTRDIMANAVGVWLETGDPLATTMGFGVAKRVLAGNIDAVTHKIQQLPQYIGLPAPAAKEKFLNDVAQSGILTGLSQADVLTSRRQGELSKIMPGVAPMSRLGSFKQFLPDGSRSPLEMLYDQTQIRGLTNKFETRNAALNWSQKLADTNDSIARLGGFIALLSKGVSPEQAASRIQNVLVNYDSLTTLERGLFRKILPWWSYNSRIGKYVVQSLMERPGGGMAQMVRASNVVTQPEGDTYVPSRLRQELAIRIPDEWVQAAGFDVPGGTQVFASNWDIVPGADALNNFNVFSLQGTIRNLLSQSNPFIKGTGEIAFDQDLFSKRPLEDADPAINKLYRRLTGGELSNVAKVVGSNIPGTQRIVGLAGSLFDDRYPLEVTLPKTAFNTFFGGKVVPVDRKWRDTDAEQAAHDRLSALGLGSSFTKQYVDKDRLPDASPEEKELAALTAIIAKRKREALKQKSRPSIVMP